MVETKVTPLYVKTVAKKFDFNTIFYMELCNKKIHAVGAISECKNLITLDLSRNNLTSLAGLDSCIDLKFLNLSYNKITSITILEKIPKLNKLELQGNKIQDFKSFPSNLKDLTIIYL